jgi:hypothetical protein
VLLAAAGPPRRLVFGLEQRLQPPRGVSQTACRSGKLNSCRRQSGLDRAVNERELLRNRSFRREHDASYVADRAVNQMVAHEKISLANARSAAMPRGSVVPRPHCSSGAA